MNLPTKKIIKTIAVITQLILSQFFLSAENLQIVMPKIIYIGDTAEVRYIFHSDAEIFGKSFPLTENTSISLRTDFHFFKANESNFTVTSADIRRTGSEYTLTINIIPWKTGFCVIPPFNLASLVRFSLESEYGIETHSAIPFIVSLSPIEVKSLVQKTGNNSFMPQSGPLTLPGTTLFLVIIAIVSLILFSALVFVILHLPGIARFIDNFTYLYSLKRNSRKTIKKILLLQKDSAKIPSDKDFAAELQHILRIFLKKRFSTDFSSVTSAKIPLLFTQIMGGSLSEKQENCVNTLLEIFNRLDYIRFAENAHFLETDKTDGINERISLAERSIRLIENFDSEEEE